MKVGTHLYLVLLCTHTTFYSLSFRFMAIKMYSTKVKVSRDDSKDLSCKLSFKSCYICADIAVNKSGINYTCLKIMDSCKKDRYELGWKQHKKTHEICQKKDIKHDLVMQQTIVGSVFAEIYELNITRTHLSWFKLLSKLRTAFKCLFIVKSNFGSHPFIPRRISKWKTFTVCTNIYCTSMQSSCWTQGHILKPSIS